jgi:hypothetical protein
MRTCCIVGDESGCALFHSPPVALSRTGSPFRSNAARQGADGAGLLDRIAVARLPLSVMKKKYRFCLDCGQIKPMLINKRLPARDSHWPSRQGAGSWGLVWLHPGQRKVGAGWSVALMSWEMPRSGGTSTSAHAPSMTSATANGHRVRPIMCTPFSGRDPEGSCASVFVAARFLALALPEIQPTPL